MRRLPRRAGRRPGGAEPGRRHRRLARRSKELFIDLGLHNVTVVHGDGSLGLPEQAPFDRVILTAAAEDPLRMAWDEFVLPHVDRHDRDHYETVWNAVVRKGPTRGVPGRVRGLSPQDPVAVTARRPGA